MFPQAFTSALVLCRALIEQAAAAAPTVFAAWHTWHDAVAITSLLELRSRNGESQFWANLTCMLHGIYIYNYIYNVFVHV